MSDKRTIVVAGATGAQGGGLVRAILNDKHSEFSVRALTRDSNSPASKALADLGAEVVQTDINDLASVTKAFEGAYGAFCVTFFWHHFSPEIEKQSAKNMADAAAANGLKHVVWSTLEDTRRWVPLSDNRMPTLMEKYKVPHFDGKGEADNYFKDSGVPTTLLLTSFYWDNFIYFGMGVKKNEAGKYVLTLPMGDAKLPGISADDIGKCAYGIFKNPSEYAGKTLGIAGEMLTGLQFADAFAYALGIEAEYYAVPPEVYRGFGFPGAEDLGNMFQFKRDFEDVFCGNRSIELSKKLNPELKDFKTWLAVNKDKIPME